MALQCTVELSLLLLLVLTSSEVSVGAVGPAVKDLARFVQVYFVKAKPVRGQNKVETADGVGRR